MTRKQTIIVKLKRSSTGKPWGIRIAGGADLGTPIVVTRVSFPFISFFNKQFCLIHDLLLLLEANSLLPINIIGHVANLYLYMTKKKETAENRYLFSNVHKLLLIHVYWYLIRYIYIYMNINRFPFYLSKINLVFAMFLNKRFKKYMHILYIICI